MRCYVVVDSLAVAVAHRNIGAVGESETGAFDVTYGGGVDDEAAVYAQKSVIGEM